MSYSAAMTDGQAEALAVITTLCGGARYVWPADYEVPHGAVAVHAYSSNDHDFPRLVLIDRTGQVSWG